MTWKLTGRIGGSSGFFAWCKKKKEICEALRIIKDTKTSLIALINEKNKERKNERDKKTPTLAQAGGFKLNNKIIAKKNQNINKKNSRKTLQLFSLNKQSLTL